MGKRALTVLWRRYSTYRGRDRQGVFSGHSLGSSPDVVNMGAKISSRSFVYTGKGIPRFRLLVLVVSSLSRAVLGVRPWGKISSGVSNRGRIS